MRPAGVRDAARCAVRGSRDGAPDLEPSHVAELFDRNVSTYDRVNTIITFGLDARWRRWAARQAAPLAVGSRAAHYGHGAPATQCGDGESPPPIRLRVLDACAGTGLLALDLARRGATVTAADAAPGMLAVARGRVSAAGLPLATVVADLSDPAAAATLGGPFDAVTVSFGLRYFADPGALLRPLRELLVPGGRLVVVEAVRSSTRPGGRRPASTSSRWRRVWERCWPVAASSTTFSPPRRAPWARPTTWPLTCGPRGSGSRRGGASPAASSPASSPRRPERAPAERPKRRQRGPSIERAPFCSSLRPAAGACASRVSQCFLQAFHRAISPTFRSFRHRPDRTSAAGTLSFRSAGCTCRPSGR